MKKLTITFFLATLFGSFISAQQEKIFLFDAAKLPELKKAFQSDEASKRPYLKWLITEADKIMQLQPGSVMEKSFSPPGGNKHDYMSLAPYFWPDPSKPDGLPYIRKDGQRNPAIDRITDKKNLVDLGRNTHLLALAYRITGQEKYAAKAIKYLQVWFADTATRMNPNLTYAQAVLGVNDGRGIGIIETVALTNVVDAVGMLSNTVSEGLMQTLQRWFNSYLDWMLTSKNGVDERHALNNHGIWYDMQVLSFSLFLNKKDFARSYCDSMLKRIAVQIQPDGRQPLELERTTALGYSTFCLDAWFKAAILAKHLGVDVWHYHTADGRGLQKALDWLIPYALKGRKWEYQQIKEYSEIDKWYFLLSEASRRYGNREYADLVPGLDAKGTELSRLLY